MPHQGIVLPFRRLPKLALLHAIPIALRLHRLRPNTHLGRKNGAVEVTFWIVQLYDYYVGVML